MKTNKKVAILALVLLVLAGIVVVIFKGFNVSLMLRQHESVDIVIGTKFDIKDVKEICKNTFQDKKYVVRTIEVFSDAVNINVESMTDEEKQKLVQGFNEKYNLELDVQELTIKSNSNVRIRDMVNPYLVPCFVSMVVITIYLIIRFRKLNAVKLLGKLYGLLIITLAGREKKGAFGKVTGALGGLYGAADYLSDLLSYSRILALTLSSAVIASTMNLLASLLHGNIIGILLSVLVYLVGHIFNLAMGLLSAYVHDSRLQYIEFYNKFYEGGGIEFKPLTFENQQIKEITN